MLFNNRLNYEVRLSFDFKKMDRKQKKKEVQQIKEGDVISKHNLSKILCEILCCRYLLES